MASEAPNEAPPASHRAFTGVAWYRFRATFARRWGGYLVVMLLTALLGGVAMGSVAAARRTQSSYPKFLASTNPSQLDVSSFGTAGPAGNNAKFGVTRSKVAHLAHVKAVASEVNLLAAPLVPSGAPNLAEVARLDAGGSVDGLYLHQDKVAVVQGRMFDPGVTDEFVTTAQGAQLLGVHLGQRVPFGVYTVAQTNSAQFGTAKVAPALRFDAKLVGIVVLGDQVVEDDVDSFQTEVLFTPALTRSALGEATATGYQLQLDDGYHDVAAVEREYTALVPRGSVFEFHQTSLIEARVQRVVKPDSIALGVFGAIAGLAALVIVGLAISRQLHAGEADRQVLRALGAGPTTTVAEGLLGIGCAIASGTLLAAVVAVVLSPLAPIGPVRKVYPSRGVAFDWTVLGLGMLTLLVGLAIITVALAYRSAQHRRARRSRTMVESASGLARLTAAAGLPPTAVIGVRFALEPGSGRSEVPVRSTLLGAGVAVIIVVATLTFGSGMRTLIARPSLYGFNWNYILAPGNQNVPQRTLTLLDDDHDVAAATGDDPAQARLDGHVVPILVGIPGAQPSPPVLSGHAVLANNQIVLGGATLKQLHKRIGDSVTVTAGSPQSADYVPPTRLVIVGTTTLPAIGYPSDVADHTSMGTGAVVSRGIEPSALRKAFTKSDSLLNGTAFVLVQLRAGVSKSAGLADMNRVVDETNKLLAADPNGGGNSISVLGPQRPAEIVNYQSTDGTPVILASGLAVGAIVALGSTLMASVRRRRRDLALLKAFGFTSRQLGATVAWQASVSALVGVAIGIPLGIVLGRQLWDVFARSIYAVPEPTVPAVPVVLVALGAVLLANAVAFVPGRLAARTPAGLALRSE